MSAQPATIAPGAELYLRMLTTGAPNCAQLDVRYRTSTRGMARMFIDARAPDAVSIITQIGAQTDVYVGCAMRARRRGTRHDLAPTSLLWADCDSRQSVEALSKLAPRPTMTVASGTTDHLHAYWLLTRPLAIEPLQAANRALANAIGADMRCADAARILRPPDTLNFKHNPPSPVELIEYTGRVHDPATILAALEVPAVSTSASDHAPGGMPARRMRLIDLRRADPLQQIKPAHYVRLLTGQAAGRDGKIKCPFHDDTIPSLHAYDTPEQGWTCYACKSPDGKPVGGDIYTLASLLWNIPTHGSGFRDLRFRLQDVFRLPSD